MTHKTRAKDQGSLQKCRIELPKLIDDMGLSVYAFRLYIHLKRIADDLGSCWESARTLATACAMSPGQVSKAKEELEGRGLIVRNVKAVRGGIGDDIAIADIWPQTFRRYAPECDREKESDRVMITSEPKRSPHDRLAESDHHTIASEESDHHTISEPIKRSYSDPKDVDLPYKERYTTPSPSSPPTPPTQNGGDGGDLDFFRELRKRGVSRPKAHQIAAMDVDPQTVLLSIDNLHDPQNPHSMGRIIGRIIDAPPATGKPYGAKKPKTIDAYTPPPRLSEQALPRDQLAARMREMREKGSV